jgi:ribonucleoside-diphosphate reductase alpha chain
MAEGLEGIVTHEIYVAPDGIPRGSVPFVDHETFARLRESLAKTKHVSMTPNARKVFKEYYIKELEDGREETVEERFAAIAIDISQAEIPHIRKKKGEPVMNDGLSEEELGLVQTVSQKIYDLQVSDCFRFNTPANMNMGRWTVDETGEFRMKTQMGSACFVLPIDDTFGNSAEDLGDGILYAWVVQQLIHKTGGGTGFSFARLRPKGSIIGYNPRIDGKKTIQWESTRGISSGFISFLENMYDRATLTVKQGNTRRGANMGIQRIDHPDFLDHIYAKFGMTSADREEKITNFNLSVAMTDEFMRAAEQGHHYILRNPHRVRLLGEQYAAATIDDLCTEARFRELQSINKGNKRDAVTIPSMYLHENGRDVVNAYVGEPIGFVDDGIVKIDARKVMEMIAKLAWANGEPGVIFIDTVNAYNPDPARGKIEATNPCGEQPLFPYGACNLGSINLSKYVVLDSAGAHIDRARLEEDISFTLRLLDNVIDRNDFPSIKIRQTVDSTRNVGLGYMGIADAMMMMKVRYGSPESFAIAEEWASIMHRAARKASHDLAEERGAYPLWDVSIFNAESPAGIAFCENIEGLSHPMEYDVGILRNNCQTTQAPTGTISRTASCSFGIEPAFSLVYMSNVMNMQLLDVNPGFLSVLNHLGLVNDRITPYLSSFTVVREKEGKYDVLKDIVPNPDVPEDVRPQLDLLAAVALNRGTVDLPSFESATDGKERLRQKRIRDQIERIPQDWREVMVTAVHDSDISYEAHVDLQAAFQKYNDSAISKTINMPNGVSPEDIMHAYFTAWKKGLKGMTVYREGSRESQVLSRFQMAAAEAGEKYTRPAVQRGFTIQLPLGWVHTNGAVEYDKQNPIDYDPPMVFTTIAYDPLVGKVNSVFIEVGLGDQQLDAAKNHLAIELSHSLKAGDTKKELERIINDRERHRTVGAVGIMYDGVNRDMRSQVANDTIPNAILKSLYFLKYVTGQFEDFSDAGISERYMAHRVGNVTLREVVSTKGEIKFQQAEGLPSIFPQGYVLKLSDGEYKLPCPSC